MTHDEAQRMIEEKIWQWLRERDVERISELDAGDVVLLAADIAFQWPDDVPDRRQIG
jgi:hypothetical protein